MAKGGALSSAMYEQLQQHQASLQDYACSAYATTSLQGDYGRQQREALLRQAARAQQAQAMHWQQQTNSKPPEEPEVATNPNELVPDVSVTRVIKWAIVLLIALALGRKVWTQFGEKITQGMNKALEGAVGGDSTP